MKIPQVHGRNKIRDAKILKTYMEEGTTFQDLASQFGLSLTRVQQIVYRNATLLDYNKKYEKAKRIAHLRRLAEKNPDKMGNKTTLDILEQTRKEIEGDSPLVDNRITNITLNVKELTPADLRAEHRITH